VFGIEMNLSQTERFCKRYSRRVSEQRSPFVGPGFLLSQLGAHAAARFAEQVAPLGITPAHVGVLRSVAQHPGRSQQAVADEFGTPPSRMVVLLDDLEERGLVERRRGAGDRRVHSLHLTGDGQILMTKLKGVGRDAERELLRGLNVAERRQLLELLQRIATEQGLREGVHPNYARLRTRPNRVTT
jgi:DNA-binding MarR family transcriptional regulator